jgi:hypothetical protein
VPGQSVACACSDGSTGAQVCGNDATYGACQCGTTPRGTGGNGGADMGAASVELVNASTTITRQFQCGSPLKNCADYDMTFLLRANATITRIDQLKVTMSGNTFAPASAIYCYGAPWNAGAGEAVGPIDVKILSTDTTVYVDYFCGGSPAQVALSGTPPPAQTSGALAIEVDGILADAAPFSARTDAPLR